MVNPEEMVQFVGLTPGVVYGLHSNDPCHIEGPQVGWNEHDLTVSAIVVVSQLLVSWYGMFTYIYHTSKGM